MGKTAKIKPLFKFSKGDHIGTAGAEQDSEYLRHCFVETGDLKIIENLDDPRQIILGRAGSGKTALISNLKWRFGEQVITIDPENLALTYVSNSTILKFFADLGVNLDPFFKLLWRHVLTVEILNRHCMLFPNSNKNSLIDVLRQLFTSDSKKDKEMNEAIKYLENWGKTFWQETEYRVKEIAQRVEDSLTGELATQLGVSQAKVSGALKGGRMLSIEQRAELVARGQQIVAEAQVQDLHKVMGLVRNVLNNRQKNYYVVIDALDENWVEEQLRYKLIMALILTAKDFTKVRNAKIILALRRDLIERVFRLTRESGFQEEKYQSLYIPLYWEKQHLIDVLDKRINFLISRKYTKEAVTHRDLLPKKHNNTSITKYIQDITVRPRDIISFFNCCIHAGTSLSRLKTDDLKKAEGEYSRSRLRALADEWSADFPSLLDFAKILQRKSKSFKIGVIPNSELEEICLEAAIANSSGEGILQSYALKIADGIGTVDEFKIILFRIFYRVGLVGLKLDPFESESWADELGKGVTAAEVDETTSVVVHSMYHRALGINPK